MDDEVLRLVSWLFDKSPVTKRPVSVPTPYYSETLPPLVRIFIFLDLIFSY
jgi:hypothetical protein